jgi:hypothetical protein
MSSNEQVQAKMARKGITWLKKVGIANLAVSNIDICNTCEAKK